MDPLRRLLDLEDIRTLKARYWRLMDTKRWDDLVDVFTDDAVMDMSDAGGPGGGIGGGGEAVVAFIRSRIETAVTVHQGHTPEIVFVSDDEATGVWPFMDRLTWPEPLDGRSAVTGWGHYHDRYRRTGGEWRIVSTAVTRLRVDVARD